MKIKILLDADETILDFVRSSRECFSFAMNAAGFPALGEQYPRFKRINDLLWREYEQGKISKQGLVVERFNRFLGEMGVTADAKKNKRCLFCSTFGHGIFIGRSRPVFAGIA